jgi:hypothetical protein
MVVTERSQALQIGSLSIALSDYMATGLRAAVIGSSGAGKSYTLRVLCEEALTLGIPCVIFDPEGEYYSLGERFQVVVIGGPQGQIPLPQDIEYARAIVDLAIGSGLALIFDLSELASFQQQAMFTLVGGELFTQKRADSGLLFVVVEEAEIFAPEGRQYDSLRVAEAFAKRGRKRGLWSIWTPHRSADFSKRVLSQCNLALVGRLDAIRDFKAVAFTLPDGVSYQSIRALHEGQFMTGSGDVIRVREAQTTHVSDTSQVQVRLAPPSSDLAQAIERLRSLAPHKDEEPSATGPIPTIDTSAIERLETENRALQDRLASATQKVHALEQEKVMLESDIALVSELRRVLTALIPHLPVASAVAPRTVTLKAPESIRSRHVSQAVERVLAEVEKLTAEQKAILKMLVAVRKATRADLAIHATRVAPKSFQGQGVSRWHQMHLTPLEQLGFVSFQRQDSTVHYRVEQKLRSALGVFNPSGDEIQQALEAIEYQLAE